MAGFADNSGVHKIGVEAAPTPGGFPRWAAWLIAIAAALTAAGTVWHAVGPFVAAVAGVETVEAANAAHKQLGDKIDAANAHFDKMQIDLMDKIDALPDEVARKVKRR